jgi:hypothetical protein
MLMRSPRFHRALSMAAATFSAAATLVATPATAASQWCTGTVVHVLAEDNGYVQIVGSWRGDWTAICSLKSDLGAITATTCKSWHATLQAALVSGKRVTVHYRDISHGCGDMPTYGASPQPGYVMLRSD